MPAPARAPRPRAATRPVPAVRRIDLAGDDASVAGVTTVAPRPRLRVVDEPARRAQLARQRRARTILSAVILAVVLMVFALAGTHAYLVSGQGQLDHLNAEVADARSRYSEARLEVAELGAPQRIVSVARDRLGMVTAPRVHYLAPSTELALQVGAIGDVGTADTAAAGQPWASVKPYLGSGR
jgi:cell division protein FtsL